MPPMSFTDLRVPRQNVLIGAGLALVASVLAACTTYGKKPELTNVIAKTADVPVGSGVIVGEVVVTQATAGDFKGFSSTCTHAGCAVNEVVDGTINCPATAANSTWTARWPRARRRLRWRQKLFRSKEIRSLRADRPSPPRN